MPKAHRQAVVMDSDSPTLPVAYLKQAFQVLDDPTVDAVLGPCDDGGYYLIGLKSPCSALFRGHVLMHIVMSTSTVVTETLERAREQGLRVACLPRWYDVDTYEDLERLNRSRGRACRRPQTSPPSRITWRNTHGRSCRTRWDISSLQTRGLLLFAALK